MQRLWFFLICLSSLQACSAPELALIKSSLDQALQQAEEQGKHLFVVASEADCESCNQYVNTLLTTNALRRALGNDFLLYQCNKNQIGNEYLFFATYSIASPTTYVFDPGGELVNVMVGAKEENEILNLVHATKRRNRYYGKFKSNLRLDEDQSIAFLNKIFAARKVIESTNPETAEIQHAVQELLFTQLQRPYFYNNYLLAKGYVRLGDEKQAVKFAEQALSFEDSYSIMLYRDLRDDMRFITGVVDAGNALAFEQTSFDFGQVPVQSRPKAVFSFMNRGHDAITIQNIVGSCNCMDIVFTDEKIAPGESGEVTVIYKAEEAGSFSKLLFVLTDHPDTFQQLSIKGIVK